MNRDDFHYPDAPYFLSHSVGLQPKTTRAVFDTAFDQGWRAGDHNVWDGWLSTIDTFKANLAGLIGAEANEICPQTNISSALTKLLFSLPREKSRRRIVMTQADFPTAGFVLKMAETFGCTLDFIESGPGLANPANWAAKLDDDVLLVFVTHVFSNLGLKTPVAEITAAARKAGAISVVDVAQSAGIVPIDVASWQADALVGTSIKYLCGGPGAGWMWANPALTTKCAPLDVGWFSHANPFEFDIHNFQYAPDAARFMGGTPNPAPFAMAANGIATIERTGVSAIHQHAQKLISHFADAWRGGEFISHITPGERGAGVIIKPQDTQESVNRLQCAGIGFDQRSGGIRLSFHLYNDENDIDALLNALA